MVLKIINVYFYSSRRVVCYVPHVFMIELLVATTHLKQAETSERNNNKGKYAPTEYSTKSPDSKSRN
jgi:hypothetical protein